MNLQKNFQHDLELQLLNIFLLIEPFFPEVVSCSSLISVTVIFKYSDKKQLAEENVNLALVS